MGGTDRPQGDRAWTIRAWHPGGALPSGPGGWTVLEVLMLLGLLAICANALQGDQIDRWDRGIIGFTAVWVPWALVVWTRRVLEWRRRRAER